MAGFIGVVSKGTKLLEMIGGLIGDFAIIGSHHLKYPRHLEAASLDCDFGGSQRCLTSLFCGHVYLHLSEVRQRGIYPSRRETILHDEGSG